MKNITIQWPSLDLTRGFRDHDDSIFSLRPVNPESDAAVLQAWFSTEHARFWSMPDYSLEGVSQYYGEMQRSVHSRAFLGCANDQPRFLLECYNPLASEVARHYPVTPGDLGMHFFVAPPVSPIPRFTRHVFRFVMIFMFSKLKAQRIVVEPDINNDKIHVLNRAMGFRTVCVAHLPEKIAGIAVCSQADFKASQRLELLP